jgi:C1A family cysteine protease
MSVLARIVDGVTNLFGRRRPQFGTGWIPGQPDENDEKFMPTAEDLDGLASSVDLRSDDGQIFNQESLGSCSANCWSGLYMFAHKKQYGDTFIGSRLQLYLEERKLHGTPNSDSGAEMREGAKVLATLGVCPETMWPYDISRFKENPPPECYTEAAKHKLVRYMTVQQELAHMKACLQEGYPFLFGFSVPQSFYNASVSSTGILPMPSNNERVVGGHCLEAMGYVDGGGNVHLTGGFWRKIGHALRLITGSRRFAVDAPANHFICRNSWGDGWGDSGYCYIPFEFVTSRRWCADFWTIREVSNGQ